VKGKIYVFFIYSLDMKVLIMRTMSQAFGRKHDHITQGFIYAQQYYH